MPDINKTDLVAKLLELLDGHMPGCKQGYACTCGAVWSRARSAADTIEAQAAEISRLRDALKPFAKAAEDIDDNNHDRWEMWEHPASMNIHVADMRRARTALEANHGRS